MKKVYLDDERSTPEGWVRTYRVQETIDLLKTGKVMSVSLDHDLGIPDENGYQVMEWIEREIRDNPDFYCPIIRIHTANAPARERMKAARKSINKYLYKRKHGLLDEDK